MTINKKFKAKVTPLTIGHDTLEFDNASKDELSSLTTEQKLDVFISKWMEVFDPFVNYTTHFSNKDRESEVRLRFIKVNYKKFVLEEGWSEHKYVMVIDAIIEARQNVMADATYKRFGKMYDEERLPFQLKQKRLKGRKRI